MAEIQVSLSTNASGAATVPLAVRYDPALGGVVFYDQFVVVDPLANLFGLALSNGGQGKIGTP